MVQHKPSLAPIDVIRILNQHRRLWLIPTIAGGLLGLIYAAVAPDNWEASQALLIRNEASINVEGSTGKFLHTEDMKVTQETILEIAKSRQVLSQALTMAAQHNANGKPVVAPTDREIEALRKRVKLTPPKGAEFGKTEVVYLKVSAENQELAILLASEICDALQTRFQQVLNTKAESMAKELVNSVGSAQASLQAASKDLESMEKQVGNDLVELRILHSSPSGASDLRQRVVSIENEIRRLKTLARNDQELLTLLKAAQNDPKQLISAPQALLESQPALKRLKDGLIDSQLKTAQLQGNMTADHPSVHAAMTAEKEIRRNIHDELSFATQAVASDSRLIDGQIALQETRLNETNAQLTKIAGLRTKYANMVSQVENCTKLLNSAESRLSDVRAKQSGAQSASLINRIDAPDTGTRPIGPGKLATVAGGLFAGLIAGLGIVVLTVPVSTPATPTTATPAAVIPTVTRTPAQQTTTYLDRIAAEAKAQVSSEWKADPMVEPATEADRTTQRTARAANAGGEKLSLKQALQQVTAGEGSGN